MTRAEKDKTVECVLSRYGHRVGAIIAQDDVSLGRLLSTLSLDLDEREVGECLRTVLVA